MHKKHFQGFMAGMDLIFRNLLSTAKDEKELEFVRRIILGKEGVIPLLMKIMLTDKSEGEKIVLIKKLLKMV